MNGNSMRRRTIWIPSRIRRMSDERRFRFSLSSWLGALSDESAKRWLTFARHSEEDARASDFPQRRDLHQSTIELFGGDQHEFQWSSCHGTQLEHYRRDGYDPNERCWWTHFPRLDQQFGAKFSCWFGISSLSEICRLYPNVSSSTNDAEREKYSLKMSESCPTGRVVVDLHIRKCLIELEGKATIEDDLNDEETSTNTWLDRFLQGCASRNIDTIQTIGLNYLIKNNAFEENQIFELLTTIFGGQSSVSTRFFFENLLWRMWRVQSIDVSLRHGLIDRRRRQRFIREKCKKAVVEQQVTLIFSVASTILLYV